MNTELHQNFDKFALSESIADVLFYLSIVLFITRAITGITETLYLAIAFGSLVFVQYFLQSFQISWLFIVFIVTSMCSYVVTVANNGIANGALFIPLILASSGVAWRIQIRGISYIFCSLIYWTSVAYVLIAMYILQIDISALMANSRNYISVYFINVTALLYFASIRNDREIQLLPALTSFYISVIAVGLSGVLSSILLLLSLVYYLLFRKVRVYKYIYPVLLCALFFLLSRYLEEIFLFFLREFNIDGELALKLDVEKVFRSDGRFLIWDAYMRQLDVTSFLFGTNIGQSFQGFYNLHSSYFLLHARTGIFSLFLLLCITAGAIRAYKRHFVLGVCVMVILFRGLTDTTFFAGSSFDFVFIYLVFFSHKKLSIDSSANTDVSPVLRYGH